MKSSMLRWCEKKIWNTILKRTLFFFSSFLLLGLTLVQATEGEGGPTSGTLTTSSSSCLISLGSGTCSVDLTWNTVYPDGTSAITSSLPAHNTILYTSNSSMSDSGPTKPADVFFGGRTFYLYNGGSELASTTVSAACASGVYDYGSLVCVGPTGTVVDTPSGCTIANGSNTCNISLSWSTTNPIGTSTLRSSASEGILYQLNNYTVSTSIYFGTTTFSLYNNGSLLDSSTFSAVCSSGGFDTVSNTCRNPVVTEARVTGNYYVNPGTIYLQCSGAQTYAITQLDASGIPSLVVASGTYTGLVTQLTVGSGDSQYRLSCTYGSRSDTETITYKDLPPPQSAIIDFQTVPSSVRAFENTTVSWKVQYPDNNCSLTARVVCPNNVCNAAQLSYQDSLNNRFHGSTTVLNTVCPYGFYDTCTSEQRSALAAINLSVSSSTDTNDPATSRPLPTAITTPAPGQESTYFAIGRKTFKVWYTTDLVYNCTGFSEPAQKRTKRIWVIGDKDGEI